MRCTVALSVVLFAASVSAAPDDAPSSGSKGAVIPHEPPIREFDSPDGGVIVWMVEGHGSVVLDVTDNDKHEIASDTHNPEDRPGGFGFAQGAWTSDSQYFVYSTGAWGNSLGPPPIFSIYIYSRAKKTFFGVGDGAGVIGTPVFKLRSPDIIEFDVVDAAMHSTKKVTKDLSEFAKKS